MIDSPYPIGRCDQGSADHTAHKHSTLHQPGETTMAEPVPETQSGNQSEGETGGVSRRNFITGGIATLLGGLGISALKGSTQQASAASPHGGHLLQDGTDHTTGHGNSMMV